MYGIIVPWLLAAQMMGVPVTEIPTITDDAGTSEEVRPADPGPEATATLLASLRPPELRELATEVLARNPEVARARHRAAAAETRAPQKAALPEPMAALTLFVRPPETRVGAQRLSASISQRFPWSGKLALGEQAAVYAAGAALAEVEAIRLEVLTETRRLYYELAFVDEHEAIVRAERDALVRYEKTARGRYSAGRGLQQEIVRIQAQITRSDQHLLELAVRRASLRAALNALRDRPADEPVAGLSLPVPIAPAVDLAQLRHQAHDRRPELLAAAARIAQRRTLVALAEKSFRPDLTVGLAYTLVERRDDPAGRASPPPDDGEDMVALSGAVNLPVWRRQLAAGLEEALAARREAEEDQRRLRAAIESAVGDLGARLPLVFEQWKLLEKVLRVQAREALRSAEAAYTTGKLNAVDLLDAEVVLFEVRIAAARTRADFAVALARLEGAVAGPIPLSAEEQP